MLHRKMASVSSHRTLIEKPNRNECHPLLLPVCPLGLGRAVLLLSDLYSCYRDRRGRRGLCFTPFVEPVIDSLGSITDNTNMG